MESSEVSKQDAEARREEEAKKKEKGMKVLVAIDEGEGSFYALTWVLDHLFFSRPSSTSTVHSKEEEEEATMILLHVQQPFQHYIFPAGPGIYATTAVVESVRKAQQQNTAVVLARALEICKGRAIKVKTMVLDGEPKEMICQAGEQTQTDLLVVGSRGLGMIKRAFLGSVSDYCAHHAKCPILIVRPRK